MGINYLPGHRLQRFPFLYFLQHFFFNFLPWTVAIGQGKRTAIKLSGWAIELGFFMLKAYPKIETTFQASQFHESTTYTFLFRQVSSIMTHTNPRRRFLYEMNLFSQIEI